MAIVGTGKDAMEFRDTSWGRRQAAAYAEELANRVKKPVAVIKKKVTKKKASKKKGAK